MAIRSAVAPTFATVKKLALAMPDVEEGTAYGSPALKLHGQLLACIPTNKQAEPDSLVVRVDFDQRDELLAAEPGIYYLKDHYVEYACVLVRLKRIHRDALRDLLLMSWKFVSSKTKKKRTRR